MKTPLIYGIGVAFAMTVFSLILHILGYSTDPEKMTTGMIVGILGMLTICITGIVLGTKAARAQLAPTAGFTYGQAFMTGLLVAVFAALGGAIYNFIYFKFIFPNFADVQIEWTRSFMERMNMPASKIDEALEQARAKMTLVRQIRGGIIFSVVIGALVSLITAAIMKRPPTEDLAAELAPPPVA